MNRPGSDGDSGLYEGLARYVEALWAEEQSSDVRNLHGIVGVDDLHAVAEDVSEQDLDRFFTAWVSEPEVPELPDAAQQVVSRRCLSDDGS